MLSQIAVSRSNIFILWTLLPKQIFCNILEKEKVI